MSSVAVPGKIGRRRARVQGCEPCSWCGTTSCGPAGRGGRGRPARWRPFRTCPEPCQPRDGRPILTFRKRFPPPGPRTGEREVTSSEGDFTGEPPPIRNGAASRTSPRHGVKGVRHGPRSSRRPSWFRRRRLPVADGRSRRRGSRRWSTGRCSRPGVTRAAGVGGGADAETPRPGPPAVQALGRGRTAESIRPARSSPRQGWSERNRCVSAGSVRLHEWHEHVIRSTPYSKTNRETRA